MSKENESHSDVIEPKSKVPISAAEFANLIRSGNEDHDAYLEEVSTTVEIEGTSTKVSFYRIAHDATRNAPDVKKLAGKLVGLLVDFACTREEQARAAALYEKTQSAEGFSQLHEKAKRLFVQSSSTGEPGEVLLYMIAERLLGYPQILCKFPLKTSGNVHAHGADGVHASIDPISGHLRLHWGEAKFNSSFSTAVTDCLETIADLILERPGAKKKKARDIELLCDNISLNDPKLEEAICSYLDPDKALSKRTKFCGIGVVGFNHDSYAELTAAFDEKSAERMLVMSTSWGKTVKTAMAKTELGSVEVIIFCIPCESVDNFRAGFLEKMGVK